MPETQTVETMYGQVEIETVDCDSCGMTIAKEDAHPFRIGDGGGIQEGYACPVCAEEGPAGFPEETVGRACQSFELSAGIWLTILCVAYVMASIGFLWGLY